MSNKGLYVFYTDKLIEDFRKIVYSTEFDCKYCPFHNTGCIEALLCEDGARFKEAIIKKYSREVNYNE